MNEPNFTSFSEPAQFFTSVRFPNRQEDRFLNYPLATAAE
jgi:hypothetical protein